ncbi:MAG: type IV pilus assembly protein PilM, partial [Akkermansiaceae bacterium]
PWRQGATVGIEIGYSTIYMVLLRKASDGRICFEECRTFEFDPGLRPESPLFTPILKAALQQFCGSSKELAIWAAPRLDRARVHHLNLPQVSPTRLPGAVYWGLQREEPFLEKETVVDFQVEEGGAPNASLNITGVIVDREGIEEIQQAFSRAGYPLTGIGIPLFALRNLVNLRGNEKQDAPVLICKLGQRTTSVSVLFEGRLVFTRNLPLGLQHLGEALLVKTLVKELDPAPSLAEAYLAEACHLVLKLGWEEEALSSDECQQHENVLELLRPILLRMVRQIERTMEYYQSNFDTEPIETIFLGGAIAARGHLFQYISGQLSPRVIAIDPFDTPELQAKTALPADNADRIAYGPAFGLALEGAQLGINLTYTYKECQDENKHRKIATAVSILLIFLTAATTFFHHRQQTQLRSLNAERDDLDRSLSSLGLRLTETIITEATEKVRALQERRRAATKRYEGLALLSEITRLTPENISLLHVSVAMGSSITLLDDPAAKGRPIKTAADAKGTLLLKGIVNGERSSLETSLTIYIARLDQSQLFHAVEVDSTKLVESSDELHLTFTLKVKTIEESKGDLTKK